MKYFEDLDEKNLERIFLRKPSDFWKDTNIDKLKYTLASFLYVPATQYDMIYKGIEGSLKGVKHLAICLEDAIGESGEEDAIKNLEQVFKNIRIDNYLDLNKIPLLYLRVKNVEQLRKIKNTLKSNRDLIIGILIPKSNSKLICEYIETLNLLGLTNMYVLPIIESREFLDSSTKYEAFNNLYNTILNYKKRILSIRIGVTDILGVYGIRRTKNFTVYDNLVCREFIRDVINYLEREEINIPISGGVSEFFNMSDELIKNKYIEEIQLDKFNGLLGKTIIHPNQVIISQALYVVNYEDFIDAKSIIENADSKFAVEKGVLGDRMNEVKPHLKWAKKILTLSEIYGVFNEGINYNELLKF